MQYLGDRFLEKTSFAGPELVAVPALTYLGLRGIFKGIDALTSKALKDSRHLEKARLAAKAPVLPLAGLGFQQGAEALIKSALPAGVSGAADVLGVL